MSLISRIMLEYARGKWGMIVAYLFLNLFGLLISVGLPIFTSKFITLLSTQNNKTSIKFIIIGIASCWTVGELSYFIQAFMGRSFIPNARIYTSVRLMRAILKRYSNDYQTLDSTAIISKLVKLPFVLGDIMHTVRTSCLTLVYVMFGATAYMFVSVGAWAGGVTLLFCALGSLFVVLGFLTTLNSSEALDKAYDDTYDHYADTLDNILSVFSFGGEDHEEKKAERLNKLVLKSLKKTFWRITFFRTLSVVMIGLYIGCIMPLLYYRSRVNVKNVGSAAMVALFLTGKFNGFLGSMWSLSYDVSVLRRLDKYLTDLVRESEKIGDLALPDNWSIDIVPPDDGDFVYRYSNESVAVRIPKKISFQASAKGTRIYQIRGSIGTGKSTLLHLLSGRLAPSEGSVLLHMHHASAISTRQLSKLVLYAPQVPMLFQRSVYENINYPPDRSVTREFVQSKLKGFNLHSIAARIDEPVEKFGSNVSGGQRQMIYLIRVLVKSTPAHKLILLDEPFSSLSASAISEGATKIITALTTNVSNRVIVYVSHLEGTGISRQCVDIDTSVSRGDDGCEGEIISIV